VSPDEEANEALNKLTQRDVRQLPVLQNGALTGLLRRRDIIQWLKIESEVV
jgi:CBS domain-containing protein